MTKAYLLKRGKSWAFRIAVPVHLRGKFKSATGRPRAAIVEGLKTGDEREAEKLAAKRRAHYLDEFDRAAQDVPITLVEIDIEAREHYLTTLAEMAAEWEHGRTHPKPISHEWPFSGPSTISDECEAIQFRLDIAYSRFCGGPDNWQAGLEAQEDFTRIDYLIASIERRRGRTIDRDSEIYRVLARALVRAEIAALQGRYDALRGQTSEMPASFLGSAGVDPVSLRPVKLDKPLPRVHGERGPQALFEQWVAEVQPAKATINRWRAVFLNLQAKFGQREISIDDAHEWARGLIGPARSAYTVASVWLNSARTVYKWATEQRLVNSNPFAKVKVTVPDKDILRDKSFTDDEVATILTAAKAIDPGDNAFKAAQRWCPWLAAYSGARMGELTQLRGQDIETRGGLSMMKITPEAGSVKTRTFRLVPLHDDLIDQGFIEFAKSRGKGPLFYNPENGDAKGDDDAANPRRPRAVKARERLASWVREEGVDDPGIRPNHAWRHTFKQVAERARISERVSDAITGHAAATAGRSYGAPTVEDMAEALKQFPRYKVRACQD